MSYRDLDLLIYKAERYDAAVAYLTGKADNSTSVRVLDILTDAR